MERYRNKKGPAPKYCNRGFTLIEVLVSGTILVIAMALIAIFFVKASKIRGAVSKESNTQVITSQMMDVVMFGIGANQSDGLMYTTKIEDIDESNGNSPLWIVFANYTSGTNYIRLRIGPDEAGMSGTTLYQETGLRTNGLPPLIAPLIPWALSTPRNLDPNDKINLESGSWFVCYDSQDRNIFTVYPTYPPSPVNTELRRAAISKIEICLLVKDKNLSGAPPFTLRNSVTLRNIFSN